MKNSKPQTPNHNTRLNNNKGRPENKDDIDSREGEEQLLKGDDRTHNKKKEKVHENVQQGDQVPNKEHVKFILC
jgi:hypothetical protein